MICEYDYTIKTLLVGDSGVGKSSIMIRFVDDEFESRYTTTVGVDYKTIPLRIDNNLCKLLLWDTAGQERFRTISKIYYRGANAVIYVYDITDRESFDNIKYWMNEVNEVAPDNILKILVGNKADIGSKRAINAEEAKQFAFSNGFVDFIEVSAKNFTNIEKPFISIGSNIIKRSIKYKNEHNKNISELDNKEKKNNKSLNFDWMKLFRLCN